LVIPDWIGEGVAGPLDVCVGDGVVVVGDWPITPTHAYVLPQMFVHPLFNPFHDIMSATRAPVFSLITSHVYPPSIKKNLLQFFTIPG
jgi:hypothetical protein